MSDSRSVAEAIDAVRRGWPVMVGPMALLAIETATTGTLATFDPDSTAPILIAPSRAATLKLANQISAADPGAAVLVGRERWIDLDAARALADPATDLAHPMQGPFRTAPPPGGAAAAGALELARFAGLLPAFFVGHGVDVHPATSAEAIAAFEQPERLAIVARARLPIASAERAEIVAFRFPDSSTEHVALVIGQPQGLPPLVRLHSECLTGDVLGSLKCDCGPQLDAALARIAAEGWGMLLYLRQEGRGIGLVNKLRAYALQDQGFDTVDANLRLGFAVDARDFGVAARMLDLLGQRRIRLLTNNPAKVAGLTRAGIEVVERVVHAMPTNPHNADYLAVKRDRTGHLL